MFKAKSKKSLCLLFALIVVIGAIMTFANGFSGYSANVVSASTANETTIDKDGRTLYLYYRVYEAEINKDGSKKVTYPEVATHMGYIIDEAVYRYKNGTYSSDILRKVIYYWYEESEFSSSIKNNISASEEEDLRAALSEIRDGAVNASVSAADLESKAENIKASLTTYANGLAAASLYPPTYYKEINLDADYYLSYNEFSRAAKAAGIETVTYIEVAKQIGNLLQEGIRRYSESDGDYYVCFTNAYGSWYETSGFERKVMAYISGSRVTAVELQFAKVKQAAGSGAGTSAPVAEIQKEVDALKEMLSVDAKKLDDLLGYNSEGGSGSLGVATFLGCFTILVREGLEAILIVGAMVAYLIKTNGKDKVKYIYIGALVAIIASALLAWLLYSLSWTGVPQEIIEGVTALIAVGVLIYVSNWMISKAESDAWTKYISGKVSTSAEKGKVWTLAFTSFLAVFREGAEVILFYQPLVSAASSLWPIIGGIAAGIAVVALVFVLIRVFGVKIPLKPFFMVTSILMALMSIVFLGSGIWELFIDGGIWPVGIISGIEHWAENEVLNFFGIYPTWLTIIPQLILLAVTVVTFVLWIRKGKKQSASAEKTEEATEETAQQKEDGEKTPE